MSLYPGVKKVNGAAYPGIWVEKQVIFVKIIFNSDISAIPASSLIELGSYLGPYSSGYSSGYYPPGVPVSAGVVADGTFGVVESVLVQALKVIELSATVLGISQYMQTGGSAAIATQTNVTGAGNVLTVGSAAGFVAGQTITVVPGAWTGGFAPGTKVIGVNTTGTNTITVSNPPTTPLVGATVTTSTFTGGQIDCMLGYAEGWFSQNPFGLITASATATPAFSTTTGGTTTVTAATGLLPLPLTWGQAIIVAPGTGATGYPDTVGTMVQLSPTALVPVLNVPYSFTMQFAYLDGSLPVSTVANGILEGGPGSTSGAFPMNSPTGTPGYYPTDPDRQ